MTIVLRQEISRAKLAVEETELLDPISKTLSLLVSEAEGEPANVNEIIGSAEAAYRVLMRNINTRYSNADSYTIYVERYGGRVTDFRDRLGSEPPVTIPWDFFIALAIGPDFREGATVDITRMFQHVRDTYLELRKG